MTSWKKALKNYIIKNNNNKEKIQVTAVKRQLKNYVRLRVSGSV